MYLTWDLFETAHEKDEAASPEQREAVQAMLKALDDSGQVARAINVGDTAPTFVLPDSFGNDVDLSVHLAKGPVVLSFFRGDWCPFCSLEEPALDAMIPEAAAFGASVLAVSPMTVPNLSAMRLAQNLSMTLLHDAGNAVAERYGLAFQLPEDILRLYAGKGLDFLEKNGDSSGRLPIPATYVIDQQGVVRSAFVDPNYQLRLDPQLILHALEWQILGESNNGA